MKALAWLIGLAAFGGLIVLSVAGVSAAIAILVTGGTMVAMIAMGNVFGGRTTPNRSPYRGEDPRAGGVPHSSAGTVGDARGGEATPSPREGPPPTGAEPSDA